MKKVLVLLLALSMIAGSVFALDMGNGLTIAGEVKTGLRMTSLDDGLDDTDDTFLEGYNNDYGGKFRTRLTFSYSTDIAGVKIRLQNRGPDHSAPDFGFPFGNRGGSFVTRYAYGWVNLMDNMITIYGGGIGDDLWGLGKVVNAFDPNLDADIAGVKIAVKPFSGLSIGAALPFTGQSGDFVINDKVTLGDLFGSAILGALYTSDVVKVVGALRLFPEVDVDKYGGTVAGNVWPKSFVRALAGVEVPLGALAIGGNLLLDTRNAEDGGKQGFTRIGAKVTFNQDKIVETYGKINVSMPTNDKGKASAEDNGAGEVEEAGDTSVGFELQGGFQFLDNAYCYLQLGSDNVSYMAKNGIFVKPGAKFTFGSCSIEVYDKISQIGAEDIVNAKGDAVLKNELQIDFNLSF